MPYTILLYAILNPPLYTILLYTILNPPLYTIGCKKLED
jgi:uncharacterized membrane-anchored protein YitT (DUF2179 family)